MAKSYRYDPDTAAYVVEGQRTVVAQGDRRFSKDAMTRMARADKLAEQNAVFKREPERRPRPHR